jgi:hypothetical protein
VGGVLQHGGWPLFACAEPVLVRAVQAPRAAGDLLVWGRGGEKGGVLDWWCVQVEGVGL